MKTNPDIRTFLLSATFKDDTVAALKKCLPRMADGLNCAVTL